MYRHLGEILRDELVGAGFKINPNYPENIDKRPDAAQPLVREYYTAWNLAYQYFSVCHRIISNIQRPVFWSKELTLKRDNDQIAPEYLKAIQQITDDSVAGKSLFKYMSTKSTRTANEDKLYTDWKIAHFHLSDAPSSEDWHQSNLVHFVERTGFLLFAFPDLNGLYLLDVLDHDQEYLWATKELVNILYRNWPQLIEKYRLNIRTDPDGHTVTTKQIHTVREKHGTVVFSTEDGKTFGPFGGGLTSAGSNLSLIMRADYLLNCCDEYLNAVSKKADEIAAEIQKTMGAKLVDLDLLFGLDHANRPVFVEKTTGAVLQTLNGVPTLPLRIPPESD
jgi:hypothetical protein